MAKVVMSLTEALERKKTLEKQIKSLCQEIIFETPSPDRSKVSKLLCDIIIGNNDKTVYTGETIDEKIVSSKAYNDKVLALIGNYEKLCSAINIANATTIVKIGNKEMTISEAIALKSNPINDLKLAYANKLYADFTVCNRKAIKHNDNECGSDKVAEYIKTLLGENNEASVEEINKLEDNFHKQRDAKVVDTLEAEKLSASIREEVESFRDEVDYKLSEINSKTEITVEFDD